MDVISVYDLINKDIRGKVICFPTDTVYGVGALIDDIEAIKKIYNLKNRDCSKPYIIFNCSCIYILKPNIKILRI